MKKEMFLKKCSKCDSSLKLYGDMTLQVCGEKAKLIIFCKKHDKKLKLIADKARKLNYKRNLKAK